MGPIECCNELHVLSGYVSSSMVKRHLELIDELNIALNRKIKLNIIIGMIPRGGLSIVEHEGFKSIVSSRNDVEISYIMTGKHATHAKIYTWLKDGIPQISFTGSANYSQNAFFGNQIEIMTTMDPYEAEKIFQSFSSDTAYCTIDEIEDMVSIVSEDEFRKRMSSMENSTGNEKNVVVLSLLTVKGKMGDVSSLNWGQRLGREPNQAYIPLPRSIGKKEFFPLKKITFTILTDDGIIFQCVTAGNKENDIPKQIESSNNSELGLYFRNRLGVPPGKKVTLEDFERYGRTDVTFVNLEDGTYYMDFSKPRKHDYVIG